jgi:hypothetical protein
MALKDPGVDWGVYGMVEIARERMRVVPHVRQMKAELAAAEATLGEAAHVKLGALVGKLNGNVQRLDDAMASIEQTQLGSLFIVEQRYREVGMEPNLGITADNIREIFQKPDYSAPAS